MLQFFIEECGVPVNSFSAAEEDFIQGLPSPLCEAFRWTPLAFAVNSRMEEAAMYLLDHMKKEEVDVKGPLRRSCLTVAAREKMLKVVRRLVHEFGAEIEETCDGPLCQSLNFHKDGEGVPIIDFFLEHARRVGGKIAREVLLEEPCCTCSFPRHLVHRAIDQDNYALIEYLIRKEGKRAILYRVYEKWDLVDDFILFECYPHQYAAYRGKLSMLKWFVAQGVPLELRTPDLNQNILHVVCDHRFRSPHEAPPDLLPTLRYLVEEMHIDIHEKDELNCRPIDIAEDVGEGKVNEQIVSYLRRMERGGMQVEEGKVASLGRDVSELEAELWELIEQIPKLEAVAQHQIAGPNAERARRAAAEELKRRKAELAALEEEIATRTNALNKAYEKRKEEEEEETMRKREAKADEAAAALLAEVAAEQALAKTSAVAAAAGGGGGSKKNKNKNKNKGKGSGNKKKVEEGSGGVVVALERMSLADAAAGGGAAAASAAAAAAAAVPAVDEEEEKEQKANAEEADDDTNPFEEFLLDNAPPDFICSISHSLYRDPVFAMDGWSYERSLLEEWVATRASQGLPLTSPRTNAEMEGGMVPNNLLRVQINDYIDRKRKDWEETGGGKKKGRH